MNEAKVLRLTTWATIVALVWLGGLNLTAGPHEGTDAHAQPAPSRQPSGPTDTRASGAAAPRPTGSTATPSRPQADASTAPGETTLRREGQFQAVLTAAGASLRRYLLLDPRFRRTESEDVQGPPREKTAPGPLDLVSTWDPEFLPFQFDFARLEGPGEVVYDNGERVPLAEAWHRPARFALVTHDRQRAVFAWPDPAHAQSPVWIEIRYRIDGDYALDAALTIYNLTDDNLTAQWTLLVQGWQAPGKAKSSFFSPRADVLSGACHAGGSLEYKAAKSLEERLVPPGSVDWVGVATHYFVMAAIPLDTRATQCSIEALADPPGVVVARLHQTRPVVLGHAQRACAPSWLPASRRQGRPTCAELRKELGVGSDATPKEIQRARSKAVAAHFEDAAHKRRIEEAFVGLTDGHVYRAHFKYFIGPKDIDLLRAADHHLDKALDFGMLHFLAVPMLRFLRWSHGWTGSWALAILLLTVLVKLVLLPLTHRSFVQMEKMRQLKPHMDAIREKYGNDQQKLNQEMMALYKTHKVNPLGGCLPMLVQMPVWFALYRTIYASVDLYRAPLFGWIRDLSAPDPYFVLPALLGVMMFLQQKVTPTTVDSAQAKVMGTVMPIVFTLMMLFLPSGLVLYIFMNTVLSMGQQLWIHRRRQAASAAAPAR